MADRRGKCYACLHCQAQGKTYVEVRYRMVVSHVQAPPGLGQSTILLHLVSTAVFNKVVPFKPRLQVQPTQASHSRTWASRQPAVSG